MDRFEAKCVKTLSSAIRCMSSLTRFKWADYCIRPTDHNNLFTSLRESCTKLVDVEILNTRNLYLSKDSIVNSPLWTFSGLLKFSFTSIDDDMKEDFYNEYTDNMIAMLIFCCPDLQELQFAQNYDGGTVFGEAGSLFEVAHWHRLRRLSFQGAAFIGPPEVLEEFYADHPGLEALYIHDDTDNNDVTIVTNLPNLRSLHMGGPGVYIYDQVDLKVARNL